MALFVFAFQKRFWKNLNLFYFFLLQINIFLVFSDYFDLLMLKIIFKNKKNIILIYFWVKNTLKNNHNYTFKYTLNATVISIVHLDGDAPAIVIVTIKAWRDGHQFNITFYLTLLLIPKMGYGFQLPRMQSLVPFFFFNLFFFYSNFK